jgi:hypothetical protein
MSYAPTSESVQKKPSKPRADELIQEQAKLVSGRRNMESCWQSLHDYFYLEAPDVNKNSSGGELDASYLWDATTLDSADVLASGFMNYLTPPTSKWARLRHKNPELSANKRVSNFLEEVMEEVNFTFNRSNFYDQMFPSYKSSGVFGTSLLFEEEDVIDEARFTNMPLKQVTIKEDARGRPVGYFLEFEWTANQAASKFGEDALAAHLKKEIEEMKGDDKKHKFLCYIAKREVREIQKSDKKNLPIEACWVDVDGRTIVEESGYNEFPAMVHRFDKRPFMPWGFSPAMKALPFARILNTVAKTNLRSMMKHTDPPIALPNNAFIAPFNSNPRASNYYNKSSMDAKDIFAFGNFGDPKVGMLAIEYYSNAVKSMMFNDAFLAFNNITKEMNNPEVMERINEKMTILGPAVGRYLSEVLNPIVLRTIGILARRGKLPDAPDEIVMNPEFEIDFVGVLAQAQRRSELNTLTTGLMLVGQMAQYMPEVMDKISTDRVVDETWAITGAPVKVLRDDDEVKQIREGRAQAAAKQQEMAELAGGAMIAKDAGSAAAGFAKAKETK